MSPEFVHFILVSICVVELILVSTVQVEPSSIDLYILIELLSPSNSVRPITNILESGLIQHALLGTKSTTSGNV